jgi:hypothetical protein
LPDSSGQKGQSLYLQASGTTMTVMTTTMINIQIFRDIITYKSRHLEGSQQLHILSQATQAE